MKEDDIKERWRDYFSKLLNEDYTNDPSILRDSLVEQRHEYTFYRRITVQEVKEVLTKMKTGKATGLDEIPIEVWKCLGKVGLFWLTKLFKKILRTRKMLDE